jgi:hypothetical protein
MFRFNVAEGCLDGEISLNKLAESLGFFFSLKRKKTFYLIKELKKSNKLNCLLTH